MKTILKITIILVFALTACISAKVEKGISYTPIFSEKKGLKQTFILSQSDFIWVMNYSRHCLPMQADISVTFTREQPYRRFDNVTYNIAEPHGYNCDGEFAVISPLDSPLIYFLRTHFIKNINVKTLAGRATFPVDGRRIAIQIAKLDWKTPIPPPPAEPDTRTPIAN